MKILKIKGENLTSLPKFEIDLQSPELSQSGVFAITGPTGAGKSTILDAICLALYGKTPRYKNTKGGHFINQDTDLRTNDASNVMRYGTAACYSEVDFIGHDHKHYKARWEVKRAHGKIHGKMQKEMSSLYEIKNGQEIPLHQNQTKKDDFLRIEHKVGLSYEQFCRSVFLAQNEFDHFLKAEPKDRGVLLQKMTGTEHYSLISSKAFRWHQDAKKQLDELTLKLNQSDLLTNQQQKEIEHHILSLQKDIPIQRNFLQKLSSIKIKVDDKKEYLKAYQSLIAQMGFALTHQEEHHHRIKAIQEKLSLIDHLSRLHRLQDLFKQRDQKLNELDQLKAKLSSNEIELQQQEIKYKNLKNQNEILSQQYKNSFNQQQQIKIEENKLQTLTEHQNALNQKIKDLQTQIQDLERQNQSNQNEKNHYEKQIQVLDAWLAGNVQMKHFIDQKDRIFERIHMFEQILIKEFEYESDQLNAENQKFKIQKSKNELLQQINLLKNQYQAKEKEFQDFESQQASQSLEDLVHAIAVQDTAIENLRQTQIDFDGSMRFIKQIYQIVLKLSQNDQALKPISQNLENTITQKYKIEAKLEEVQTQLSFIYAKEELSKYRAQLKDHEPCPLCGSLDHPGHEGINGSEYLENLEKRKSTFESELLNLNQQIQQLKNEQLTLNAQQSQIAEQLLEQIKYSRSQIQSILFNLESIDQLQIESLKTTANLISIFPNDLLFFKLKVNQYQSNQLAFKDLFEKDFHFDFQAFSALEQTIQVDLQTIKNQQNQLQREKQALEQKRTQLFQIAQEKQVLMQKLAEFQQQLQKEEQKQIEFNRNLETIDQKLNQIEVQRHHDIQKKLDLRNDLLFYLPKFNIEHYLSSQEELQNLKTQLDRQIQEFQLQQQKQIQKYAEFQEKQNACQRLENDIQNLKVKLQYHQNEQEKCSVELVGQNQIVDALQNDKLEILSIQQAYLESESQEKLDFVQLSEMKDQYNQSLIQQAKESSLFEQISKDIQYQDEYIQDHFPNLQIDPTLIETIIQEDQNALEQELKVLEEQASLTVHGAEKQKEMKLLIQTTNHQLQILFADLDLKRLNAFIQLKEVAKSNQKDISKDTLLYSHLENCAGDDLSIEDLEDLSVWLNELQMKISTEIGQKENHLLVDQQKIQAHLLHEKNYQQLLISARDLEKKVEQLHKINTLIGSSGGNKFNDFVQNLSLDLVLHAANGHLKELYPRYELIRATDQDLELQLVDLDLGGEVRSVNGLSGGERFLVSLALALALSSVSSKNVKIESLFIDEGFGTLDMDTLELALSALESLQATGRQIGLISHVENIARRLGAEVRVTPLSTGCSDVTVHFVS